MSKPLSLFLALGVCWLCAGLVVTSRTPVGVPDQESPPQADAAVILDGWLSEEDLDFLRWDDDLRDSFYRRETGRVTRGGGGEDAGPIVELRSPAGTSDGGGVTRVNLPLEIEVIFRPRPPRNRQIDVDTLTIVGRKRKFGRWWSKDVTRSLLTWVAAHRAEGAMFDQERLYLPAAGFKRGMYQFDISIDDVEGDTTTASFRLELRTSG